jgi:hypothetical protein
MSNRITLLVPDRVAHLVATDIQPSPPSLWNSPTV